MSLLAARRASGLRQAGLAELVGVAINTVRKWEQGRALPSPRNLKRLQKILGNELTLAESIYGKIPARRPGRPPSAKDQTR